VSLPRDAVATISVGFERHENIRRPEEGLPSYASPFECPTADPCTKFF
jgi:hypothetical protein